MASIPSTMRAIIQTAPGVSAVQSIPVPRVEMGSVLVKVEVALLHPNFSNLYQQTLPAFRLPYPIVPGSNAVGRVAAVGPDTTSLEEGQLVLINTLVSARDDPSVKVVWGVTQGLGTPAHSRLYTSTVRNGVYAEYVLAPLEATFAIDEARLLGNPSEGGLGYEAADLLQLASDTILYAGLRRVGLQAGERIIITPATGHYSAATVDVAVAMGARVVAASRSAEGLRSLQSIHPSIETVQLTGVMSTDGEALAAFGAVDVVADVSPPSSAGSNNLEAAVSVLGFNGRVVLLGGRLDQVLPVPYMSAMAKNLTIKGSFMYDQQDQLNIFKLAESGMLKIGPSTNHKVVAAYGLDQMEEAIAKAVEASGPGSAVIINPQN